MSEQASFLQGVVKATAVDKINSMIIFGPYGTGKTWLGASADEIEDYSPVLIVDIEGSAAGVGRKYPNVDIVHADSHQKLEIIKNELLNKEHPYKTVIFDTLNVAQDRAEKAFRAANPGDKWGVWAQVKDWTIDFARSMHHADFLAIFIAHPQVDKDENTGRMTTTVKIAGSAREFIPTIPDLIGYVGFEDVDGELTRFLQVGRSDHIVTKNRFGLEDRIYDPTLFKIQSNIIEIQKGDS